MTKPTDQGEELRSEIRKALYPRFVHEEAEDEIISYILVREEALRAEVERLKEITREHLLSKRDVIEAQQMAEAAEARAAEAEKRRGPCIVQGCTDDARANYPVCYNHRQEAAQARDLFRAGWEAARGKAAVECRELAESYGKQVDAGDQDVREIIAAEVNACEACEEAIRSMKPEEGK